MKKKLLEERERAIREEEEKKEKIIQKVELFLKEELKPQIFTDKLNIHGCDSCSICCDTFIKGTSQVSITPCSHIFHHECLEKWIKEKITNPHCPNCMQSFLEYIDNPMKIKIKKKVGFINNNLDENKNVSDKNGNIYEDEVKEEIGVNSHDDIPPSEQMRINNLNNLTNQKENNEDIKSDKEIDCFRQIDKWPAQTYVINDLEDFISCSSCVCKGLNVWRCLSNTKSSN